MGGNRSKSAGGGARDLLSRAAIVCRGYTQQILYDDECSNPKVVLYGSFYGAMPTFTTVALDSLIEPKASKPVAGGKVIPEPKLERRNSNSAITRQGSGTHGGANRKPDSRNSTKTIERKHHWTQISPALYATPEPTPLPDSPLSFPPSPYIVDHKRRGPRLSKTFSENNALLHTAIDEEKTVNIGKSAEAEDIGPSKVSDGTDTVSGDDFFDPHDSMSVKSSNDGESNYESERALHHTAPFAEFYDAWEELATETGIQHTANDVEAELSEMQMGFLIEMEKKKQAESRLSDMKSQWGRIREQLSIVGLTFPADPTMLEDEPANDPGEELCRQVNLLRFVSNAVGKGIARAELEEEFEAQLQSKNFEIARLLDRLHYYEAVNHEMSQRNQETVETMRCLRQRRMRRQKWIWGSIAAAITLGSTALAWSYLPTAKGSSSTDPSPTRTSESNR
ncbi:hypothetical protein Ccrd_005593 [Cynara cardunculus var. scolymus]|uniref:Uncharacterized protein n=1 Tax=Cynara cardunculus var. scolymus TaxID=59895 RepID=A0A118JV12_CYNCS|nr:hypothetical protein Ccrd_005593 [Cynara cardunculus var. scolymus]